MEVPGPGNLSVNQEKLILKIRIENFFFTLPSVLIQGLQLFFDQDIFLLTIPNISHAGILNPME